MQTQVPSTLQQGGSEDAKCHPWEPVDGCMDCSNVEAGVGSICTHPSTSWRIRPWRRRQGRISVQRTRDDSKQITNWGRSLQIIHEEVGLADIAACECREQEQTADHIINSCPLHRPPSEAGLLEVGPLTRARWKGILTRFNKIAIQGTPQMAVDKEARAYRESTHIVILSVPCPYNKCDTLDHFGTG